MLSFCMYKYFYVFVNQCICNFIYDLAYLMFGANDILQGMVESAEENKAHHKNPKQIVSCSNLLSVDNFTCLFCVFSLKSRKQILLYLAE